ncbi:MAG TPA: tetratricopeptide repeat protein, partial [Candidatus Wallbacteria bacterium]|nr:tetratricopeptide repeat protein [Candidatus Wallbacteria bacterium]
MFKTKNYYLCLTALALALSLNGPQDASAKSFLDSLDETLNSVDKSVNDLNKSIGRIESDINKSVERLNSAVNNTVKTVNDEVKKVSGDVKTVSNTTVDRTGNVVTNTVNSINSGVTRISTGERTVVVNNQARTISGRVNEIIGSVNNAINPMANQNVNPPVNTPINRIDPGRVSGNPETVYSEKALEGMALLGDRWAKLKLDEIRAKKMADRLQQQYKSISWLNLFKKLDALSNYKDAQKYYVTAAEQVRQYEVANPNSGGIVQGIDQINESVLEFKALFGDKKAQAQLELLRAKRDYEKIKLQYDSAGLFEKLKYRGELKYAQARYEEAVKAFENVSRGGSELSRYGANPGVTVVDNASDLNGNINRATNTVTNVNSATTTYTSNTNTIYNNGNQTTVVYDNVTLDKNGRVRATGVTRVDSGVLSAAKNKMDAAYKKYIDYLSGA